MRSEGMKRYESIAGKPINNSKGQTNPNMDVLVEVHNDRELERGLDLKSPLLGINNRNLNTFEVTLNTTRELATRVPEGKLVVAESGIYTSADLSDLADYGARAFLIGESLMRQNDVAIATQELLANFQI